MSRLPSGDNGIYFEIRGDSSKLPGDLAKADRMVGSFVDGNVQKASAGIGRVQETFSKLLIPASFIAGLTGLVAKIVTLRDEAHATSDAISKMADASAFDTFAERAKKGMDEVESKMTDLRVATNKTIEAMYAEIEAKKSDITSALKRGLGLEESIDDMVAAADREAKRLNALLQRQLKEIEEEGRAARQKAAKEEKEARVDAMKSEVESIFGEVQQARIAILRAEGKEREAIEAQLREDLAAIERRMRDATYDQERARLRSLAEEKERLANLQIEAAAKREEEAAKRIHDERMKQANEEARVRIDAEMKVLELRERQAAFNSRIERGNREVIELLTRIESRLGRRS